MAHPHRLFAIYHCLHARAASILAEQEAAGQAVSGTIQRLLAGDAPKLLRKWGEEMGELCGVIEGTHDDPYILEATQTYYWASCYAVVQGADWDAIGWEALREQAPRLLLQDTTLLMNQVERLVGLGADAKPSKLFLLWCAADVLYRQKTPPDKQWSVEQIMDADLADLKKRDYILPCIEATAGIAT